MNHLGKINKENMNYILLRRGMSKQILSFRITLLKKNRKMTQKNNFILMFVAVIAQLDTYYLNAGVM